MANRQDQSPGNNWDYIETTGGTVYLKYKSWDTDGYWSGPYTRAEWSSSIGSETIRVYEHSSYSEQYNNGIYLIQESSSFTNFPSTIAFTGWWNDQFNRHYQLTTSTDTFIQYELYDANGLVGAEYGSTFTSTPSGILFNVEDVGDSSTPFSYSNGSTFVGTSGIVQAGDSLTLWTNATGTGTAEAVLTVPDFFYEAPSVPDIQPIVNTGGSWNGVHSWASPTTETINGSVEYHYKLSFDTNSRIAYRTIDKTWYDADISSQPSALSSDTFSTQSSALVNPQYVWIGDTSATNTDFYLSFDNPYYEAPAVPQPTLVNTVSLTGGNWMNFGFSYQHEATDATNTYYEYNMSDEPTNGVYFIAYNWTTKKWFDTNPTNYQNTFGTSATDIQSTSRETIENPEIVYVMATGSRLESQFNNPYYEAPPNYNLQSFTYNGLTADENESLTEYQGLWRAWDWTWVEGDGDGVIYTKSDWTLHKNTDGSFYVVKSVDGFTSGNFSPDANGIATVTFNWNEHTGIMFKPPA